MEGGGGARPNWNCSSYRDRTEKFSIQKRCLTMIKDFSAKSLRYFGCLKFRLTSFLHLTLIGSHFTTTVIGTTHQYLNY